MFIFSPALSLFPSQDQLIAELERIQLELDQLRARPGGSYSRSVPFRHSNHYSESPVWPRLAVKMLELCLLSWQALSINHSTSEALNAVSTHRQRQCWYIYMHTHWLGAQTHMYDPTLLILTFSYLHILTLSLFGKPVNGNMMHFFTL